MVDFAFHPYVADRFFKTFHLLLFLSTFAVPKTVKIFLAKLEECSASVLSPGPFATSEETRRCKDSTRSADSVSISRFSVSAPVGDRLSRTAVDTSFPAVSTTCRMLTARPGLEAGSMIEMTELQGSRYVHRYDQIIEQNREGGKMETEVRYSASRKAQKRIWMSVSALAFLPASSR